jgi:integrase
MLVVSPLSWSSNYSASILETANLKAPGIAWHSPRHWHSKTFLEMGGRLEGLQKSLGHASIKITEDTYGDLTDDRAATLARHGIYQDTGPRSFATEGGRR